MIVQACLNGARPSGFHPALPTSPKALNADARAVVRAGAGELHLHVRGADGAESLEPAAVAATLGAVWPAAPGALVGISTGAWIERDEDRRLALIAGWTMLPHHASVNLGEAGAPAVIELLHRRGVGIEAGLASEADAERLVRLGLAPLALRILIEIEEQDLAAATAIVNDILELLLRAGITKPILLHGCDAAVWPLAELAFRAGFSTRVGLEDGLTLPDGSTASGNAALVAAAVELRRRVCG